MAGSNLTNEKSRKPLSFRDSLVGLAGFEPTTPWKIPDQSWLFRKS